MKYLYSALIILIAFFAIPPVLDYSGHIADHFRQMSKGKDADDSPTPNERKMREEESKPITPISKPTAIRMIKE
jgi:hypothetical protein